MLSFKQNIYISLFSQLYSYLTIRLPLCFSLKDTKLQNALRATKARVDTTWKKTTTTTTAGIGTRTNVTTGEVAPNGVAAQRKVLTRSNSVRLGTSSGTTNTGLGLQRHASATSHLLVGQNKVKTLTTKLVENKLQHVKSK